MSSADESSGFSWHCKLCGKSNFLLSKCENAKLAIKNEIKDVLPEIAQEVLIATTESSKVITKTFADIVSHKKRI